MVLQTRRAVPRFPDSLTDRDAAPCDCRIIRLTSERVPGLKIVHASVCCFDHAPGRREDGRAYILE